MRRIVSVCVIFVLFVGAAIAQKSKPWTEWSKKDTEKMLNSSAWGQTETKGGSEQASTTVVTATASSGNSGRDMQRAGESGASRASSAVNFRVRFITAKPIREAFARMVILSQSAPNEELSAQLQGFVDRDFGDIIVVAVNYDSEDSRTSGGIQQFFSKATAETLKEKVYLERKDGKKLLLSDYKPPINDGMGAKFVFPRTLDGQPFLTSEIENMRFVVEINDRLKFNAKFKTADMMYNGKLEY